MSAPLVTGGGPARASAQAGPDIDLRGRPTPPDSTRIARLASGAPGRKARPAGECGAGLMEARQTGSNGSARWSANAARSAPMGPHGPASNETGPSESARANNQVFGRAQIANTRLEATAAS